MKDYFTARAEAGAGGARSMPGGWKRCRRRLRTRSPICSGCDLQLDRKAVKGHPNSGLIL